MPQIEHARVTIDAGIVRMSVPTADLGHRWRSIARGQSFPLKTASVSIVGYEKESPAIVQWNA